MNVETVLLQSLFAYVVLFIISKILGKKQIAQLEFTDYVIGISIGSIAAAMAVEPDLPMYHFIIAMAVFGLVDIIISLISRKSLILKKIFKGKPIILIENGNIIYKNLKKSKLDLNELLGQCRESGYFFIYEIEFCIFETDGKMSILPKSANRDVVAKDFKLQQEKIELSKELIIDGKIVFPALASINKNREWLFKVLKLKYENELKNILMASYNDKEQTLYLYYKDKTENKNIIVQ